MAVRGIRGAITCEKNTKKSILDATKTLLEELLTTNKVDQDEIASIFFSVTPDLTDTFPAIAARGLGMTSTPLFCLNEIPVTDSLPKCIRILIHVNTDLAQMAIKHSYLRNAKALRPDQSNEN